MQNRVYGDNGIVYDAFHGSMASGDAPALQSGAASLAIFKNRQGTFESPIYFGAARTSFSPASIDGSPLTHGSLKHHVEAPEHHVEAENR
jgi:hypothetical protein